MDIGPEGMACPDADALAACAAMMAILARSRPVAVAVAGPITAICTTPAIAAIGAAVLPMPGRRIIIRIFVASPPARLFTVFLEMKPCPS